MYRLNNLKSQELKHVSIISFQGMTFKAGEINKIRYGA
jgi:hypothetical protein